MPVRRAALAFAFVAALVLPGSALSADRMKIGFQDDVSFRWSSDSPEVLDRASSTGASIIRATADWSAIAPKRPADAANGLDASYRLNDLDNLVRGAQERGMDVLITIWGTPKWAGPARNKLPRNLADLRRFSQAVADRYSGRHIGYPYVGRFSVWNEPNLGIFLSPQFDAKKRIVSPKLYASIYKAAAAGIRAGSPTAQIGIGETSALGRDKPKKGSNDSVAPATFARMLAKYRAGLKFDAYAQHPYPTRPNLAPTSLAKWPNVVLPSMSKFEKSVDSWFHRRNTPVWITEYGHETKPGEPLGVSLATQSKYTSTALSMVKKDQRVEMFIWFIFRDNSKSSWQSGFYTASDSAKPALATFTRMATAYDGEVLHVRAATAPMVKVSLPRLAHFSGAGSKVTVQFTLQSGSTQVDAGTRYAALTAQGTVSFPLGFKLAAGKRYTLNVNATDEHGNRSERGVLLVA
jgi:cellulase (glycosyl hydrolase family 5)